MLTYTQEAYSSNLGWGIMISVMSLDIVEVNSVPKPSHIVKKMVKQFRYRPGVAQRVPGS